MTIGRRFWFHTVLAAGAAAPLMACTPDVETRKFGVARDGSEQNRVTNLTPLSLPPSMTQRPSLGAPRVSLDAAEEPTAPVAATTAPGNDAGRGPGRGTATRASSGERALLQTAGPAAPGTIRGRVDQEAQLYSPNPALTESVLFGPNGPRTGGGQLILPQGSGGGWFSRLF